VISAFPIFALETLPPIFREYLDTRPGVQLQLHVGRFPEVLEQVNNGVSDFGVTYVDTLPETVHRVNLWKDSMYIVVPRDHPLGRTRRTNISLADLQGTPLVSLPSEAYTRRLIDGAAASEGIWLKHSVIVPGFLDILNQVSAGVGVGIVPGSAISDRFLTRLKTRLLTRPSLSMTVGLIALRTRHMTPAASALISLVLQSVDAHRATLRNRFLASGFKSFEELPRGPYEILWRPATTSASKATDGSQSGSSAQGRQSRRARQAMRAFP
jgi:DNA-binding transcriptional LysR family regulator